MKMVDISDFLYRIIDAERKQISFSLPAETVTILEASRGKRKVRLIDGSYHEMKEEEVNKLCEIVPKYYLDLIRIPIIISKEEDNKYSVEGCDMWQRKLIEIIFNGKKDKLTQTEVETIITLFGTIIFINLSINNISLEDD
jgi:uncharacterized protein (UPF0216 family)